jgi:hypothetical protein
MVHNTKTLADHAKAMRSGIANSRYGWALKPTGVDPATIPQRDHTDMAMARAELYHVNADIRRLEAENAKYGAFANGSVALLLFCAACAHLGGAAVVSAAMLSSRRALLSSIPVRPAMNRVLTPIGVFGMGGACTALPIACGALSAYRQNTWNMRELHMLRLVRWSQLTSGKFSQGAPQLSKEESEELLTAAH